MKRCSEMEIRAGIAKRLGHTVHKICRGVGNLETFEDLMEDIVDVGDFVEYFKAVWFPRLGLWITALKNLPLASQESSAAMEFYHNQMRLRLMNEKEPSVYQRADWLVDKLGTKVHSYFWLDEYSGKDDFARYRKDEWLSGLTAWRKSLKIPDTDVVMEGECVQVVDQEDQDTVHVIWNPGSEFAICDCNWASKGNLCEHVIKTINVFREKGYAMPSVSMSQFNKALVNMLQCPPYDSLIRDHAVSLAVWVQTLLSSQIGQDSSGFMFNPEKEQSMGSHDRDVVDECHYRIGNMSSQLENGFARQLKGYSPGSERGALSNHIAAESRTCDGARVEQTCDEMQIDPSSISNSVTQSFSVTGNVLTDSLAQNRGGVLIDVDQDLMKNLPSTHADFVNESGVEEIFRKNGCDTEMETIDIPSLVTSSDGRAKLHQNGVSSSNDCLSPSVPKRVDSQLVNMDISDVVGENGGMGKEETVTQMNASTSKDYTLNANTVVDHIHPFAVDLEVLDVNEASNTIEKIVRMDMGGDGDTTLTPSMDSPVDIVN